VPAATNSSEASGRGLVAEGVVVDGVLDGVDLLVRPGEVVALTGTSGAGKSTLLRACVRLVDLAAGTVRLDGTDVRELDPRVLRRRVGLVAQHPVMLPGTVADNLAYGLDGLAGGDRDRALLASGLDASFASRDAARLSGGEQARVGLARALTRRPEVLLLDEPAAALDAELAERVGERLRALATEGLAVCLTSHDRAVVTGWADREQRLTR
jgi:ABC-type multidrug transport system fused ATPase/permease subunit